MIILADIINATIIFAIPLLVVALGGMFSERSGTINIALEGIMIIGALFSCLYLDTASKSGWGEAHPILAMLFAILIAGLAGIIFSLFLALASETARK